MDNKNDEIRVIEEQVVIKNDNPPINVSTEEDSLEFLSTDEDFILIDAPVAETMLMETQTTDDCPYLGVCRITNHALLYNRDSADQHPISAISGLEGRLNAIEKIDALKSASDVMGIYYPWYDSYDGNDRTGYFVSYRPEGISGYGGIVISNGIYDVIGVTVTNAGYTGNYAETIIDGITIGREDDFSYGLVALSGIVNVRTTDNPAVGGYVIANEHGMAKATDNTSGYRVLAKGNNGVYDYVTIFLGVNQNSLAKLYDTVIGLSEFTEEDKKRLENCVTSEELAEVLSQIEFNIKNSTEIIDEKLQLTKEELEKIIEDAQKEAEAANSSAASIQRQVNQMQESAVELENSISEEIEQIRTDMQDGFTDTIDTVDQNLEEAMTEFSIFVDRLNSINDEFAEGGTIADMKTQIDDNSARLDLYIAVNNKVQESIVLLTQQVTEDGGVVQSLILDVQKYSVGRCTQSYNMTVEEARAILMPGIIYVPIQSHTETLYYKNSDSGINYSFRVGSGMTWRYEWNGQNWVEGAFVLTSSSYFAYDGTSSTSDLWYCPTTVRRTLSSGNIEEYEAGTLYKWEIDRWIAIASTKNDVMARALGQVRQTAKDFSIQFNNLSGDFSLYQQTVEKIKQVVGGENGDFGSFTVTKDGLYGEVFNPNGTAATLRARVDDTRAMIDLLVSGYYHKLASTEQGTVSSYDGKKYTVQPTWDKTSGKFVFDGSYQNNTDGVYYFFDSNQTHYCKAVGNFYEVYECGNLATAGVDAQTFPDKASVNLMATLGNDTVSSVAGLRNLALENEAKTELLASLSTDKLQKVETPAGFAINPNLIRYSQRPTWNSNSQKYVFDSSTVNASGLYIAGETTNTYRKLISDGSGGFIGYEIYEHDTSATAGLVAQVLDNEQRVGMVVSKDGKIKGGVVVDAINDQVTTTIDGDRLNIKGITTVSNESGNSTIIDGSRVTLSNIRSTNYSDTNTTVYSSTGTNYDFTNGAITSKNFAIDSNGNAYFRGNVIANSGEFHGTIGVGACGIDIINGKTIYNFTVDPNGNVIANSGTFTGTMQATDMLIRDPNTGTYTSILNATTKKIKSDWIENFSVDTLTTGIESDGDYNYFIDISGRKIIFNKRVGSSDIVVGQISARYSSASGEFLTIAPADSFEISNPNSNTPYLLAEGSGMELVGKDSNTAQILINTNDDGEIKILGDLYVNGVPYGVAVFG